MAKRNKELAQEIIGKFNTSYSENEDTKKRGFTRSRSYYENTPIKSERDSSEFQSSIMFTKIKKNNLDTLSSKDILVFFRISMETLGNKLPLVVGSKTHNVVKTLIKKYGSKRVFNVVDFLFNADHPLIDKRVITPMYVNANMEWLQAYGDLYSRGEDFTCLLKMCKPITVGKKYEADTGERRESDFGNKADNDFDWS